MPAKKMDRIRKRDGRLASYDEGRITESIYRAARAAGREDRYLARDLAGAVTMYLERYYDKEIPSSEEIHQMVEKILNETGNATVAEAYLLHRQNKGSKNVLPATATDLFPAGSIFVEGSTRDELSGWDRGRIVRALMAEAGVSSTMAAEVAAVVEQRIFRLGRPRVSTSLIRSLVNEELLARNYSSKLGRQLVIGVPKHDLHRWVGQEQGGDSEELCLAVGETTLKQYALQEIFSRDVADAHVEGRIHVEHLESPFTFFWISIPSSLVLRRGMPVLKIPVLSNPPTNARTLTTQLSSAYETARRMAAAGVEFHRINLSYEGLSGSDEEAAYLVAALGERSRTPAHLGIDLSRSAAAAFVRSLLPIWNADRAVPSVVVGPETFREPQCVSLLQEVCRWAAERRRILFILDRSTTAASSGSRFLPERSEDRWSAIGQVVALNLPQAFLRAETGGDVYAELDAIVATAIRAHRQKQDLLKRMHSQDALGWENVWFGITLVGLNDMVTLMCGREMDEDESALRLALKILSYVHFRLREESVKQGVPVLLADIPEASAGSRFLRIDAQLYARTRGLIDSFSGTSSYTEGFHLRSVRLSPSAAIALEARFHTLVPAGRAVISQGRSPLTGADLYDIIQFALVDTPAAQVCLKT